VAVDSGGHPAVMLTGNGSITAPSVGVVGTVSTSGKGTISNLQTGIQPVADPLAGISLPSLPRPKSVPSVIMSGGSKTISPGVYQNVSLSSSANLTLNPGIYVILGQFSASGLAQVSGSGVSLYLACSSYPTPCGPGAHGASLSLTGNGAFHLSGPTTGCVPLTIFSDPHNASTISLAGNGGDLFSGNIYASSGATVLTGNGSTFVLAGRVIAATAALAGNGNVTLAPPGGLITCSLTLSPATAGPNPIRTSQQLTATVKTATGSPVAGLTVAFTVTGANPATGSALTDASGNARFAYIGTKLGTDTATASLTQGGTVLSSNTSTITWVKATAQISTRVSPSTPITIGASVTDIATVSGGFSPTGSVSWNVYKATDTTCQTPVNPAALTATLTGGSATSPTFTAPIAGTYQFVAGYSGDGSNQAVTTACGDLAEQIVVNKATPGISTRLSTSTAITIGASVTDTATLSGGYSPDGVAVTWKVYKASDTACQTPVNPTALTATVIGGSATSPAFTPPGPGSYQFVASYPGDVNNRAVSGTCGDPAEQIVVKKATPSVSTSSAKVITIGGSATDTATVAGGYSPTGSVTWNVYATTDTSCQVPINSNTLTATLNGTAAVSPPFAPPAPGTYQFVATYQGDVNNLPATGGCGDPAEQFVVNKAKPAITTTLSPSGPITVGSSATDTATVSGGYMLTGSVTWNVYTTTDTTCQAPLNSSPLSAGLTAGSATSPPFNPASPGTYQFVATYTGDGDNLSVSTACTDPGEQLTVNKATPAITTTLSPSGSITIGASATDKASVSGGYSPDGVAVTWNVYKATDTTCQTPLNPAALTATLTGASATSPAFTPPSPGTYQFVATYAGDGNNLSVSTGCTDPTEQLTVNKAKPVITTTLLPSGLITVGSSAMDAATVSGGYSPTGSVTWNVYKTSDTMCQNSLNSSQLSAGLSAGSATSPAFTPPGSGIYQFVATYGGDGNNLSVSTACTDPGEQLTVNKATPAITTTLSPPGPITAGSSAMDAASVSGGDSPTGSVTWNVYNASDTTCQTPLNSGALSGGLSAGRATSPAFTPSAPGTYEFVATYGGDANNGSVSTACADPGERITVKPRTASAKLHLDPPTSMAVTGTATTLTATVTDASGNPLVNQQVAYTVAGTNSGSGTITTDQQGHGSISYTGARDGSDTVEATVANTAPIISAAATITWTTSQQPVGTTPATGNFFGEPPSQTTFVAAPGDTAAFKQLFPTLNFNPPAGTVQNDASGVTPATRPFTDITTDTQGNYTGTIPAAGKGLQAGVGTLNSFDAYFTANLVVTNPGDMTIQVIADDGFLFGLGGGATRVSGDYTNAPASGVSPFKAYPLVGAYNQQGQGTPQTYSFTAHFPSAGEYPYELDYFSCCGPDLSLALVLPSTSSVQPNDAGTIYVTQRGAWPDTISKVTVDQSGHATVQTNFGSSAIPPGGPDSLVFDHHGDLLISETDQDNLALVDPATGAVINPKVNATPLRGIADLAMDPNSDTVFGFDFANYDIYAVNEDTGGVTFLNPNNIDNIRGIIGIAITPDGSRLFVNGVSSDNNVAGVGVFEVDPHTVGRVLRYALSAGSTGDGMTIDPVTGHLFAVCHVPGPCMSEYDLGTATNPGLSLVDQFPIVSSDGLAADGHGHILMASTGCCLDSLDVTTHTVTVLAAGIPNADDPAPVTGPGAPVIHIPIPPAVNLSLVPNNVSDDIVGQNQQLTVSATDPSGQPVGGIPVTAYIRGANNTVLNGTTAGDGRAQLSYAGTSSGADTVQATAPVDGLFTISNQASITWLKPQPPAVSGSDPPSISNVTPAAGSVIAAPTPITATAAPQPGDQITSYAVTLQSATSPTTTQTLASGSGAPPPTIATIDPSQVPSGPYTVSVSASAAGGGTVTTQQDLQLQSVPPTPPPVFISSAPPTVTNIQPADGSLITTATPVMATITPGSGDSIANYSLTLQPAAGGPVTLLASGTGAPPATLATLDPTVFNSGPYALTVLVTGAIEGVTNQTIYVTIANNLPAPSISSASPPDGTRITAPTPVSATITPPTGLSISAWSVTVTPVSGGPATTVATGTGAPPATLGTIDPTLLLNGTYTLEIDATTAGGGTEALTQSIIVDGALKLGHYVKTFSDLRVPVGTTSLDVQRVYDSYDKSSRDFGVGWHLDLAGFRVSTNGPVGSGGWSQQDVNCFLGGICQTLYTTSQPHNVTVTWPDGHQEVFAFDPQGTNNLDLIDASAAYSADPNTETTSTLQPADSGALNFLGDGSLYLPDDTTVYDPTTFILTAKDGTQYLLSTTQGLVAVTDRNGNTTTIGANGIASSAGPTLAFNRDGAGRITSITDPDGHNRAYTYSATGDLSSSVDFNGNATTYTYDANHDLLASVGPNGKPIETLTYDASGRLTSITDANGVTTPVSTDVGGRTITITDPASSRIVVNTFDDLGDLIRSDAVAGGTEHITTYSYDSLGNLLSRTDPDGGIWSATYDSQGNLTSTTDPTGAKSTLAYGTDAQPTSITDPAGATATYAYDVNGNLTSTTNPLGATTTYTYNSLGEPLTTTDAQGHTSSSTYDGAGRQTSTTDPDGHSTSYTYDGNGNLLSTTNPDGSVTTASHDAQGHVVSETSAAGRVTHYGYDALGRLTNTTNPLGKTSTLAYDNQGNTVSSADPTGATMTFSYDADGRPTASTDPLGHTATTGYDAFGNLTSSTDPSGHTTSYTYDPAGRRLSATDAVGNITRYGYDAAGHQTLTTQPNGATETTTYDPDGRPTALTDALHGQVTFAYDAAGEPIATTNPNGVTTSYTYDPSGNLLTEHDPATGTTSYTYDPAGNRITTTNANRQTVTDVYDAMSRVTSRTGPGITDSYAYDADGQLTTMTDPTGATSYGYDANGQLTQATSPQGSVGYSYDSAGRRSTLVDSNGTVTYGYNTAGQLTSVTNPGGGITGLQYDPAGNRTSQTEPNGVSTITTYTPNNQVASITTTNGATTIAKDSYTYDALGNRTGDNGTATTASYAYDALGRLTGATTAAGTTGYTYDPAGNLLSATGPSGSTNYVYNSAGQLTSDGTNTYSYDPAGNRTSSGASQFGYDALGEITSAVVNGNTYTYGYSGNGLRTVTTAAGTSTGTLWDTATATPLPVQIGSDNLTYADSTPTELATPTGDLYPVTDGQGSVTALTDLTGGVVGTQSYSPFGAPTSHTGVASPLGYTGQITDPTGLLYLRARYYDPTTASFLTPDSQIPNGPGSQGYNLYSYTQDNPLNLADPTGHQDLGEEVTAAAISATLASVAIPNFQAQANEVKATAASVTLASETQDNLVADTAGTGSHSFWGKQALKQSLKLVVKTVIKFLGPALESLGKLVSSSLGIAFDAIYTWATTGTYTADQGLQNIFKAEASLLLGAAGKAIGTVLARTALAAVLSGTIEGSAVGLIILAGGAVAPLFLEIALGILASWVVGKIWDHYANPNSTPADPGDEPTLPNDGTIWFTTPMEF
jgi:RHS repeat-associated protein